MADGRSVNAALDFAYTAPAAASHEAKTNVRPARPPLRVVPADHIPLQATRPIVVSLTHGCEAPLDALRAAPERVVTCHPCDEAVVRLLLMQSRRNEDHLQTCAGVDPGTLRLG